MKNFKLIEEALTNNFLRESTQTGDVPPFAPLVMELVKKIYPETLVSQIADVQPISAPYGKVAALYNYYTGDDNNYQNDAFLSNTKLIAISDDPGLVIGTSYVLITDSATGTGSVLYQETFTYKNWSSSAVTSEAATATLMVMRSDDIALTDYTNILSVQDINIVSFDGETPIYQTDNRTAIKKVFSGYSGPHAFGSSDESQSIKHIETETKTVLIETKTRKIKSDLTYEKITDFKALYGDNYADAVATAVASSIKQEIDKEVISYIRSIATTMWDATLTLGGTGYGNGKSLGMQSGIFDVSNDIVFYIYAAAEAIVKATKRNRTMFVIADPTTIAYLQINPWRIVPEVDKDNPFYVGKLGAYPLYCDLYARDNYVLVGYRYDSDQTGDAGLIYAPYMHTFLEIDDVSFFQKNMMTLNRYGYIRHPQDTGTGVGDSDFFRTFYMNYDNIPNLSDQMIRVL
jgi:hypothetical protein